MRRVLCCLGMGFPIRKATSLISFEGIWPQLPDFFGVFNSILCELASHGCRDIYHPHPVTVYPDLCQQFVDVIHSSSCLEITFQVMAVARQSTCYQHTIRPGFQGIQDVDGIHFACARHLDYF